MINKRDDRRHRFAIVIALPMTLWVQIAFYHAAKAHKFDHNHVIQIMPATTPPKWL